VHDPAVSPCCSLLDPEARPDLCLPQDVEMQTTRPVERTQGDVIAIANAATATISVIKHTRNCKRDCESVDVERDHEERFHGNDGV